MRSGLFYILAALMLTACSIGRAADGGEQRKREGGMGGGPIVLILDNAKELGITDAQKDKLEALRKEIAVKLGDTGNAEKLREKARSDPELKEALKALREARESGDKAKVQEIREKYKSALAKEGGPAAGGDGKPGAVFEKLREILTPEQLKKVKDLSAENREKMAGGRSGKGGVQEKGNKPDTSKEAPQVFE